MQEGGKIKLTNKAKYTVFAIFISFCLLILATASYLNYKTMYDSRMMLESSVKAQLLSIASAAQQMIDTSSYTTYTTPESIDNDHYREQLTNLRSLASHTKVEYIYALKRIDNQNIFIFDIDTSDQNATLEPYDISPVHERAFAGENAVGISNLVDEYGSFSSCAMPLYQNQQIVGIIGVDLRDDLLTQNKISTHTNFWLLVGVLAVIMATISVMAFFLLNRIKKMQDRLRLMANYDKLTNLPNRQYLMDYLQEVTGKNRKPPFALFFIDLDNFKKVNDNAGHDAGDALLVNIGHFLDDAQHNSRVFRPGAGALNIAARIGGDEFLLILPGMTGEADASAFANELISNFRQNEIDRYIDKYQVGLSIGIAFFPYHSANYNVLIKYADIAMYHAKHAGKNCYRIYNDEMENKEEK